MSPGDLASAHSRSHHPRFDFDYWAKHFPVDTSKASKRKPVYRTKDGELVDLREVNSPIELAESEQVRWDLARRLRLRGKPADIFVFREGEPPSPYLTKFGGRPYWPVGRPVPLDESGNPMRFIGQLCFLDSLDIIDLELPGEVLVIFDSWAPTQGHERYESFSESKAAVWVTRAEVEASGMASGLDSYLNFVAHGQIHRTMDYHARRAFYYLAQPALAATRVGRGGDHPQRRPDEAPINEVGCVYSFRAPRVWPDPADPHTLKDHRDYEHWTDRFMEIMIGDVGGMYFNLEDDGTVSIDDSCG
ncbi:MAG: DUF1963 domain-containing protein [Phycisphaerales bacterium JB050]